MVEISVKEDKLIINVKGITKIFSLRSELTVDIKNVVSVKSTLGAMKMPKGLRAPGTAIPGLFYAGTFYSGSDKVFWDVRHADKAIVIEHKNENFKRLVVEVENPSDTVTMIQNKI
ncbi:MAG: hypothetical protein NTV95_02155 [Candidatus Saccharibacteria bacterium]|nr:hypothetical protein [Candidatus Saccharibacteria bacterium]